MKVITIGNPLTIDIVTYKSGNTVLNKEGININSSWRCDLDEGMQSSVENLLDFQWFISDGLLPLNTAVFYHYSN